MAAEHKMEEPNGKRRANLALIAMGATIVMSMINIIGSTTFWLSLPEKLKTFAAAQAALELRVQAQESRGTSQEAVLARVDERTKAIQDDVRQLHQDFSFRASGKP